MLTHQNLLKCFIQKWGWGATTPTAVGVVLIETSGSWFFIFAKIIPNIRPSLHHKGSLPELSDNLLLHLS